MYICIYVYVFTCIYTGGYENNEIPRFIKNPLKNIA